MYVSPHPKYETLRLKYFSDPNYKFIENSVHLGYHVGYLYEFNFLSLLIYNDFTKTAKQTAIDMSHIIRNYNEHPGINWHAYIDYIDEVRQTLPPLHSDETLIYEAVDSIRSEIRTLHNSQQVWL